MKKILILFSFILNQSVFAGGHGVEVNPAQVILICEPQELSLGLQSVQLEQLGSNYQTRIFFEDKKNEIYYSEEVFVGSWPRMIMGRPSKSWERVKSFDIMSPRMQFDYGVIELKIGSNVKQVRVNCHRY